ncbi:MAG: hypothetical protein ACYDHD_06565 [Vulcanimicrobiaceae bacterium]
MSAAPLVFDVVGAAGPTQFFSRLPLDQLAHAYLFSGPAGVGKKTFARRLAQSLLCHAPKPGILGYDESCVSCRLFTAAEDTRHPDFLEHVGSLKIGDADAPMGFYESAELSSRDLVRLLSMRSYSGGRRILLLGDLEFATHHAANALLKFFEEPPSGVLLVVTTAAPGRLPGTIRSRLVEVRFGLLSRHEVREVLLRGGCDPDSAQRACALAQGSVTQGLAALAGQEESLRAAVAAWFFDVVRGRTPQSTWATRETLNEGLAMLKTLVRDWSALGLSEPVPLLAADYAQELRCLEPPSRTELLAWFARIDDAAHLARTNVSPAMVCEAVRMSLTRAG